MSEDSLRDRITETQNRIHALHREIGRECLFEKITLRESDTFNKTRALILTCDEANALVEIINEYRQLTEKEK